jgi:acyl-coenzyme A thioesterase PaaI-like protein
VLPPHYSNCFGCGPDHPTGLHLRATVADGVAVTASFTVGNGHQGAAGLAHGGVLATAMDEALGFLLFLLGEPAVTGKLETEYRLPVPVGSTLYLSAEASAVQGRKIYGRADAKLGSADGPVAVLAAAVFIKVGVEHFERHGKGEPWRSHRGYNP